MKSSHLETVPPWKAIFGAVPWTILIVAVTESLLLPFDAYAKAPLNGLWIPILQVAGQWQHLLPVIAIQLVFGITTLRAPVGGRYRELGIAVAGVAMAASCWYCYDILVGYERFAGYPPFIAFFGAIFLYLIWWTAAVFDVKGLSSMRYLSTATRIGIPAVGLLGFVGLSVANYRLYDDAYPTLHMSMLTTGFILLQSGLAGVATLLKIRFPSALFKRWPATVALLAVTLTAVPLAKSTFVTSSLPQYLRFSVIGRYAVQHDSPLSGNRDNAAEGKVPIDPDGVERFLQASNLPTLPKDFRLEDYNILQISVEATRFRETSFGNKKLGLTPNLERYAQKKGAFVFTRAFSGSSYTVQSFSSLFRMIYPSATGVHLRDPRWDGYLDPELSTVPGYLDQVGYDTFWRPYSSNKGFQWLLGGFMDRFADVDDNNKEEDILESAMAALTERADSNEKFFGWVFFSSPHHPYDAHYDDMPDKTIKDRYRQEIRYVDGIIGRLLDHLDAVGLADKTIVIIHGDHGEELKEHGNVGHHSIYAESIHVPLLIRLPGIEGRRIEKPTSIVYVYPWLFLNGSETLKRVAEERLQTYLGPVLKATDNAVLVEVFGHYGTRSALIYDGYTLLYDFASKYFELYDNKSDPEQKHNIYQKRPEVAEVLTPHFNAYLDIHSAWLNVTFESGEAEAAESEEQREAIKTLMRGLKRASVSQIAEALSHKDWRVRREAAKQLGERKVDDVAVLEKALPLLADESKWVRKSTHRAFGKIGVPAIPALLRVLESKSPYKNIKYRPDIGKKERSLTFSTKMAIGALGADAVPALIAALNSDDTRLKRNISGILGRMGPKAVAALPHLLKLTEGDDVGTRYNALGDLVRIAPLNPDVIAAVTRAMDDPNDRIRGGAAKAKARIAKAEKRARVKAQ